MFEILRFGLYFGIFCFGVSIEFLLWRWKIKYGLPSNHLFQRAQEHGRPQGIGKHL